MPSRRKAQSVVEVDRDLIAVKAALGHGHFLGWIGAEFGMSEWTARNYMRFAEVYGGISGTVPDLPMGALYELAAPSTPEAVREAVVERAAAGDKVTAAASLD